jgi:hypothetical protein
MYNIYILIINEDCDPHTHIWGKGGPVVGPNNILEL